MTSKPATIVILTMFGSFAIILATMIILFRPDPIQIRSANPPSEKLVMKKNPVSRTSQTIIEPSEKKVPQHQLKNPSSKVSSINARLQRKLEQEHREITLLKITLENRLKNKIALRTRKLTQFARQCENLEPGEAAQLLLELDDETLADVLQRINRNRALSILILLKQLGRKKIPEIQ